MKKWLTRIMSWVLTFLIVIFVGISALALMSRMSNKGVAKVFDYSFMHVLTDSMEPEYKVGTGIIVKEVDYRDLKVDDDIAFFKQNGNKIVVVMHRIINIDDSRDPYVFTTKGINLDSDQCSNQECQPDYGIFPSDIVGKVIQKNSALGFVLRSFQNSVVQLTIIIIPLAGAVIYAFFNLVQSIKEKDDKSDKLDDDSKTNIGGTAT